MAESNPNDIHLTSDLTEAKKAESPRAAPEPISPDAPELRVFAEMAEIPAGKLADAFNDPEKLFDHMSLEELARFKVACDRLAALQARMSSAMDLYMAHARGILAAIAMPAGE